MKSINWLILGFVVLLLVATPLYSGFSTNNLSIIVDTNGSNTNVNYPSILAGSLPQGMMNEIKNKASDDLESSNSTADTVKADIKSIASKYNYNANVKIVSQFGTDQLPMIATVKGTSMVPTLQDGQEITIVKTNNLKVGDIVVAVHPTYGLIVKRLSIIDGTQVYLTSDNKNVEVVNTEKNLPNGTVETITVQKTPLNTWLPTENVIGVVKVY
jgi:signal peptidase I